MPQLNSISGSTDSQPPSGHPAILPRCGRQHRSRLKLFAGVSELEEAALRGNIDPASLIEIATLDESIQADARRRSNHGDLIDVAEVERLLMEVAR